MEIEPGYYRIRVSYINLSDQSYIVDYNDEYFANKEAMNDRLAYYRDKYNSKVAKELRLDVKPIAKDVWY